MKKTTKNVFFVMSLLLSSHAFAQAIVTESTSNSTTNSTSKSETTVKSPPPSAIAPAINSMNNDICSIGVSGAAQTQILGIAIGSTFRDENCERLKLAKNLYDMGMKVAAVATLCQDERVFVAMKNAGTPCPIDGKIGNEAKAEWEKRDLSVNSDKDKLGKTGFYQAPINLNPDKNNSCGYSGNDEIIKQRMGC